MGENINGFPLIAPSVGILLLWMIVPLVMTLWFSFQRYNMLDPTVSGFAGLDSYRYQVSEVNFWASILNMLLLIGSVLVITAVRGVLLAVLFDQDFPGRIVARLFAVAPFFAMPTVAAPIRKNLIPHPTYGFAGSIALVLNRKPIDFIGQYALLSVILIVS